MHQALFHELGWKVERKQSNSSILQVECNYVSVIKVLHSPVVVRELTVPNKSKGFPLYLAHTEP
jgi:hypothetical protein